MPLQNRVTPFGEIVATRARGTLMGNRGGRLHRKDRSLGPARWRSKAWIACRLDFRCRHRHVMGSGYTELFFLDEATALAAGHRPCFECRHSDARAFQNAWAAGHGIAAPPRAGEMDEVLHEERRNGKHQVDSTGLPDGTVVADGDTALLMLGGGVLRWTHAGYEIARMPASLVLLTPPSIVRVLAAGYRPALHPSAKLA